MRQRSGSLTNGYLHPVFVFHWCIVLLKHEKRRQHLLTSILTTETKIFDKSELGAYIDFHQAYFLLENSLKIKYISIQLHWTFTLIVTFSWMSDIWRTIVGPSVVTHPDKNPEPGLNRCLDTACSKGTPSGVRWWQTACGGPNTASLPGDKKP